MINAEYSPVIGWENPISHNLEIWTGTTQKCDFPSQSQGCILRCTSNHGISPNDNEHYSG